VFTKSLSALKTIGLIVIAPFVFLVFALAASDPNE